MMKPWRLLAFAAAVNVMVGVGAAAAQTVVVRNAPAGSTVELVLNTASLGSATVDANGDATLPVNLSANLKKMETDALIYVDVCDKVRRVILVERATQPPPLEGGCERREIAGVFLVRQITTLVVNVGTANPTVLLIQGRYSLSPEGPGRFWSGPPTGLVLFGGGSFSKFRDATALACGAITPCERDDSGIGYTAGVGFWISPYLGAEASYLRPAKAEASGNSQTGNGQTFRFNSSLDAHVVTIVGKVGGPIGSVRLYGQAGATYHRATFGTSQSFDEITVVINNVSQTIEGGTQNFELKTAGWGWVFGGGMEAWLTRSFGLYAEAGRTTLKGAALDDEEGSLEDGLTTVMFGARIHIGR
ncbi:MAG: outer membrane beta-barrel protein, partial [Burkholderiales bacterium]